MAYVEKISERTYRLTVSLGYDAKGKKLRKRKTVKMSESLTQKQLEKELNIALVLFEKEVLEGEYLDGENITFAEFTDRWLKNYAEINLAPATLISYKIKLKERILPAIGHICISKLQPTHLLQFYHNLQEPDVRLDCKYIPKQKLVNIIQKYSNPQIEKSAGITFKTVKRLKSGESTDFKTAEKICRYLNCDIKNMFDCTKSKQLSEKTIRSHMGIIGVILSTAVKWNVIKSNPIKRIDMKKAKKSVAKYYDDIQVAKMLNELNNEPLMYVAMVYLSIDIGLRKSELTGLTWGDIDFDKSQININKQRHYVQSYGTMNDKTKTDAGIRVVTASQTVMSLLRQYRNKQIEQKLKLGTAWHNEPYVFLHDDGKAISPNLPYKWFVNFLDRHNLPKITFHQLRHTNASILISSGEDVVTISGRLGHSDKNITLNTYSHIIKSKEVKVASKMDEFYSSIQANCSY